jgi:hypothetical protein
MIQKILFVGLFATTLIHAAPSGTASGIVQAGESIFEELIGGLDVEKNVSEKATEVFSIVKHLVEIAEDMIKRMTMELEQVEREHLKLMSNYTSEFHNAKSELREARQALRSLAEQTDIEVETILGYLKYYDNTNNSEEKAFYLKKQIKILKNLMKETEVLLTEVQGKYNNSIKNLGQIGFSMDIIVQKLETRTDKASEEYQEWTTKARAGVYGTCSGTITALIFADIFGCAGICSTINGVACGAAIAGIEVQIAETEATLMSMKMTSERVGKEVGGVEDVIKKATETISKELAIIGKWEVKAKAVERAIENNPIEEIKKYDGVRNEFRNKLKGLQDVVWEFLAQPVTLF